MKKLFFVAALGVAGMMSASNTIVKEVEIPQVNKISEKNSVDILPLKMKKPGEEIITFNLSCCTGATWPIQDNTAMSFEDLQIVKAILEAVYCDE